MATTIKIKQNGLWVPVTGGASKNEVEVNDTGIAPNEAELWVDLKDLSDPIAPPPGGYQRALFEAAGAKFNEVTGFYELNGLTDITIRQMEDIYNAGSIDRFDVKGLYFGKNIRTNLFTAKNSGAGGSNPNFIANGTFTDSTIEVIKLNNRFRYEKTPDFYDPFYSLAKCHTIIGNIDLLVATGIYINIAPKLHTVNINLISRNSRIDAPLLSYESVEHLIKNSGNRSVITISINKATYSYIMGTAQPTPEVGGTAEQWKALNGLAQGKQISFAEI